MRLKTKYNQSTLQDIIDRDNDEAAVENVVRAALPGLHQDTWAGLFVAGGVGSKNHRPFSFIDEETVVVVNYEPTTHRNLKEALIYARLMGVKA